MKATKTHVSTETARMLKDCGVGSEHRWFYPDAEVFKSEEVEYNWYPMFSWREVLWEHPDKFFGEEFNVRFDKTSHIEEIVNLLAIKKYQQADDYFRLNCKLIEKLPSLPEREEQWKKTLNEWADSNIIEGGTEFNEGVSAGMRYLKRLLKKL